MKQLLFIGFFLLCVLGTSAQDREAHREKIKALKTAHITEGIGLTAKEAQVFWPIYNEYEQKRRSLYRREHQDIENLSCLTEETAENKLQEYIEIEREDFLLKKKYYEDLKKILLSAKMFGEDYWIIKEIDAWIKRLYKKEAGTIPEEAELERLEMHVVRWLNDFRRELKNL